MNIKIIKNQLKQILSKFDGQYAEVVFEEKKGNILAVSGNEVEDVKSFNSLGGNCRILYSNGWGFVSFTDLNELKYYFDLALKESKLISTEKIHLKKVPVLKTESYIIPDDNPLNYSLEQKMDIVKKYNDIMKTQKNVQTTSVKYKDLNTKKYFFNVEGTEIYKESVFCGIMVSALARKNDIIQNSYYSTGDKNGFTKNILNLEDKCNEVCDLANRLLHAEPVKPGKYKVVIDQKLAGVFAHEAFGHLSESDFLYENDELKKVMKLGKKFGPDNLNIIDDPTIPNLAGSYDYDDEGVKTRKNYLIKNGKLTGRLHSRETAYKMDEEVTGNARSISYNYGPIVRMSNTYIDNGNTDFKDMIKEIDNGIYAKGALGGMTNTEMFTFSAEQGYIIKNGEIKKMIRDVILTGNVFTTLHNIQRIGNDLKLFGGLGGCGKAGQSPLPVNDGGPHLSIKDVVIGGK